VPDKLSEDDIVVHSKWGVFGATTLAFFLAEMGDKTQIATVMLGANYQAVLWVALGTTLGMMLANVPAVWLGERFIVRIPLRVVHSVCACIFLILAMAVLAAPAWQRLWS